MINICQDLAENGDDPACHASSLTQWSTLIAVPLRLDTFYCALFLSRVKSFYMALAPGTILNNRYRIVSILGQGGMGAVYQAWDENLGISVAVKENQFLTDEYARQFQREANILGSLRHPSLPRGGDFFSIANQGQYLIMDFIEGEDLRQRIERMGTIPDNEVIVIGAA